MARSKRIAVLIILTLGMIAWTDHAEAAGHHYLILGIPRAGDHHRAHYQPRRQTVTASAYAWGWFGARPYTHGVRHRGYYGNSWAWGQ